MRKSYSQYIQYIKLMLGAVKDNESSLEYLNDTLTEFVKVAFSEVEPYINVRKRVTLPWDTSSSGGAIDFKLLKIKAKSVTAVRRGSPQGYMNNTYTSSSIGSYYYGWFLPIGSRFNANFDPIVMEQLMLKCTNEISGDKHFLFDYDNQYLFINFNQQYPSSATIDFIPEYISAEQVDDTYWVNILQQYSLALVKISLSHYRGKFTDVDGAPYKLNYQKLEQEGREERDKIWSELMESNLLNYRFD